MDYVFAEHHQQPAQRALAICKPVERLIFYVRVLWQTVLYVDHNGACLPTGALPAELPVCQDGKRGCCVKQIVKLPARIEYAVSGIDCYSMNKYTINPCEKQ